MTWTKEAVHELVCKQREFFLTGKTLDVEYRIEALKKLRASLYKHQKEIEQALYEDLGRHHAEAYFCDIGSVIMELNETLHGLKKWARPETHFSGLTCFPSILTKVYKMPYGVSLIISPFNFPFLLSVGVLVASIAGGNTAVMKASSKSKACTKMLEVLIKDTFDEEYVCVVDGGHDIADLCLEERFDKIFYTGSPKVGIHVMEMAAKHLTPVALELGGETGNWAVVRADANIKDAARKIAFFKICNSGQICININQVAVAKEVALQFIDELKKAITKQIGEHPIENKEYPKLISKGAYDWCVKLADEHKDKIVFGGKGNPETNQFDTTILYPMGIDDDVVNEELFNPLLPVVEFEDAKIDELMHTIATREHGLALYLFTKDIKWAKKEMSSQQYGGGCINEVILHLMVKGVPFNGTGHSGMGAYHGEWGFREFTHPSTCMIGSTHFNLPLREHPYEGKGWKKKLLGSFLK